MKETKIYVGMNDSETLTQKHDDELYVSVLKKVCYNYHVPFSFYMSEGGYFHENGDFTQEQTLVISLLDADEKVVEEIAKDLCVFFHQESVMITVSDVRTVFIKETIE